MQIAREIGDRRGEGQTLFNSADELYKLGDRQEAMERMQGAAEIFEEIDSPHAEQARSILTKWRDKV